MVHVVEDLGDELINTSPDIPNGNSPFALVTHVVGACEWWVGHILLGAPSTRNRDEEFSASGTVAKLVATIADWLAVLEGRKADIAAAATLAGTPQTQVPLDGEWTVGAVLLHAYEELSQHLGHLEVTADVLRADRRA